MKMDASLSVYHSGQLFIGSYDYPQDVINNLKDERQPLNSMGLLRTSSLPERVVGVLHCPLRLVERDGKSYWCLIVFKYRYVTTKLSQHS